MNCETALSALSAMLDGALTDSEQRALDAHLAVCPSCRKTLSALQAIDAAIPEAELPPPAALRTNVMRSVRAESSRHRSRKRLLPAAMIGVAAAAALALAALGLLDLPGFSDPGYSTASLHTVVEAWFPGTQSDTHDSAAARDYAEENQCAVLAIWGCNSLAELDGLAPQPLSDGGQLYPVDAETLEQLLSRYSGQYAMESYAPSTAPASAAIVLYP